MTPKTFVDNFYQEKLGLIEIYFSENQTTEVGKLIAEMNLDNDQFVHLRGLMDAALTDAFYTILLGLDGAASIGSEQHDYTILNEEGRNLTETSEIETIAWERFHGP